MASHNQLITDNNHLKSICEQLSKNSFIAVDTEFLRDKTYFPQLCLVQVAGKEGAFAIDVLKEGIDLSPLCTLLADKNVLKVFHAARQDIEVLMNLSGSIPAPLFDTQVAAMVCGFGESASYENLASRLAHASIDKTCRFTDWTVRPLSDRQIAYALSDVTHLRTIYQSLKNMLDKNSRIEWVQEEMAILTSPITYLMDPETAWKRLRLKSHDPMYFVRAKRLARWREQQAQKLNIPRSSVMKDATLLDIAAFGPLTVRELRALRSVPSSMQDGATAEALLQLMAQEVVPEETASIPAESPQGLPGGPVVELLKVLLKAQCDAKGIAEKLVASAADLARIAHMSVAEGEEGFLVMHGWRYELFGHYALALKEGRIALTVKEGKVMIVER